MAHNLNLNGAGKGGEGEEEGGRGEVGRAAEKFLCGMPVVSHTNAIGL